MLSSYTSLLARLLTRVLAGLLATPINSLVVEVRKGRKAEHLMSPVKRWKVTIVKRGESANFYFTKKRTISWASSLRFIPTLPDPGRLHIGIPRTFFSRRQYRMG